MSTEKTTKNKGLGVPPRKASGSGPPSKSSRPKTVAPGFPSDPSRKETEYDRMGIMILEIAAVIDFRAQIDLDKTDRGLYTRAFISGCRYVQSCNRKARDLAQRRKILAALGIGAARPKGGVSSAAKDGTRAKPGASRATPKPLPKKK